MEYLIVTADFGKNGRDDVLRLGLSNPKRRTKFADIFVRLKSLMLTFYCNAVEYKEVI